MEERRLDHAMIDRVNGFEQREVVVGVFIEQRRGARDMRSGEAGAANLAGCWGVIAEVVTKEAAREVVMLAVEIDVARHRGIDVLPRSDQIGLYGRLIVADAGKIGPSREIAIQRADADDVG